MTRRLLILLVLAALAPLPAPARAAPTVTVRARTRLQIDTINRTDFGVRVIGKLVEIGAGTGAGGQLVTVRIQGQEMTPMTNFTGRFEAEFYLSQGVYELSATFSGSPEYSESSLENYRFDVGKETLTLTIRAPASVDVGGPGAEIVVEALSQSGPQGVRVALSVGDLGGSLRSLDLVETDRLTGKGKLTIPRGALGAPGDKRVKVEFHGDDAFNPASAETTFRLVTTTAIEDFRVPAEPVKYESKVVAKGRLVDAEGAGVSGASIGLTTGGKRVASALTDRDGDFTVKVKASEFTPGDVTIAAEYVSTTASRRGARTSPATIRILEPRPVPLAYTIGAVVLTFGVILGFILARTRPWEAALERWRRRRRRPDAETPATGGAAAAEPRAGLKLARPSIMSTLRRPADLGISGVVRDVITNADVAGARLAFSHESHAAVAVVADAAGRFELQRLEPGVWRVEVAAHGYVSERFSATVPHKGELRDVRIDLLPVRERVFGIYRDVAVVLLPKKEMWGVWTPREILDHVRAKRPAGALGALTDFVEETYFSPRVPDESILPVAMARAQAAQTELPPPSAV